MCRLLVLQFKTYSWKGSGVILVSFVYFFFLFQINFSLAAGTPFKISVVPGEITELPVNYSQCHSVSILISLLQSERFGLLVSFIQLKWDTVCCCVLFGWTLCSLLWLRSAAEEGKSQCTFIFFFQFKECPNSSCVGQVIAQNWMPQQTKLSEFVCSAVFLFAMKIKS